MPALLESLLDLCLGHYVCFVVRDVHGYENLNVHVKNINPRTSSTEEFTKRTLERMKAGFAGSGLRDPSSKRSRRC